MNLGIPKILIYSSAAFLALSGCSKKPDVKTQTSELEKAFPAAATAPDAYQAQTPTPQAPQQDANAYVKAALSAVKSDDYAASVIALQTAQRSKGATADQLMAIERAKQALTASLVERAARGDEKAKADLSRIEKTMSQ
jgi:hypothetical protein